VVCRRPLFGGKKYATSFKFIFQEFPFWELECERSAAEEGDEKAVSAPDRFHRLLKPRLLIAVFGRTEVPPLQNSFSAMAEPHPFFKTEILSSVAQPRLFKIMTASEVPRKCEVRYQ
jgi:hypothetical protein